VADTTTQDSLPYASVRDTLGVLADVVTPNVAKGPIIRRPKVVGWPRGWISTGAP
jgi:hypothetical protein